MRAPEIGFVPTIPVMIGHIVELYGDDEALVTADDRTSYAALDASSREIARQLVAGGVAKGTRIGIMFPNGIEWVTCFLAVARIGAIAVPMSTFYRPGELRKVLQLADIRFLLGGPTVFGRPQAQELEAALPSLAGPVSRELYLDEAPALRGVWQWDRNDGPLDRTWLTGFDDRRRPGPISDVLLAGIEAAVSPADLAVLIHTSGSSADPKGVFHTHGAVVRHGYQFSQWGAPVPPQSYIGRHERTLVSQPFFWVAGLMQDLMAMLMAGGTLLLQDRFDPERAVDLVERERATRVSQAALGRFRATRPDLIDQLAAVDGLILPTQTGPVHMGCGMTETLSNHTHAQEEFDRVLLPDMAGSCGTPVPFMQHRIVNPDTGEDVAEGEEGLLLVRGYALMAGMNKQEREEVFDQAGWYATGDRCLIRDGYLYFLGRYSDMIKTSGANVSPAEVEQVLMSLPDVAAATVVGIPDAHRGQLVAAAVVSAPGCRVDVRDALAVARKELSPFKVPRRLRVYDDDTFPRLANGKPDKRTLAGVLRDSPDL
jgi:acyl-CoA synthetase (AMP-forming)/AMP-acid ligase II